MKVQEAGRAASSVSAEEIGAAGRSKQDRASPNGHASHLPRVRSVGEVHWLSSETTGRLLSVIIPVKNGMSHLPTLLPRLLEQEAAERIELVAVDSGSDDGSQAALQEHGATILEIDPASFNHGATRNLAARHARGDILVFINQTTLPRDNNWLANLVAPFAGNSRIAGVCSRVLPHEDADPLTRIDGLRDPSGSEERQQRAIADYEEYRHLEGNRLRLLINFHTVSAAIRSDVLHLVPFREVLMGEDIFWARDVLEAGYVIQHEPTSVVWHSHDYSPLEILQRNVDDGIANQQIVGRRIEFEQVEPMIEALVATDWQYLKRDVGLKNAALRDWQIRSVLRRTAQVMGQWIGTNHERLPFEMVEGLSLTESIKRGSPLRELVTGVPST